ncbi:MAG: hypothetical protein ISS35_01280 [Kiritimatiellae bacterium]|nr:hypothetical protein [Kiritimatiellia bacterium]
MPTSRHLLMGITILTTLIHLQPQAIGAKKYKHQKHVKHYEGTKTCIKCHKKEAKNFFHSQHYQWQGATPGLVNTEGQRYGKINTINDFCTSPKANWIGLVRNSRGEVITKGCSKCHAGLGKLPSPTLSDAQLENIDCLICHASGYRRDLYKNEDGSLEWKPILWKNTEGMNSVSRRISLPTRTMCLRCHSASGGGPNYKRGDIEYALRDCERDFDVHMSPDGGDLHCIDCHAGKDHRVRGRGADLSGTDMPDAPLSCSTSDCHGEDPHDVKVLNHHTKRVACETCHIPTFAKEDATDMMRDWSKPSYNEKADKYSATITTQTNVIPVYAWYNGTTRAQLPSQPAHTLADGKTVGMMLPQGSRQDSKARIYPFKLHKGKLPMLKEKKWIVPIVVESFFADGDINKAIHEAAHDMYGIEKADYTWVDTVRYMGIYHEVTPKEHALKCLDCHAPDTRLNWKALGYDSDPLEKILKN